MGLPEEGRQPAPVASPFALASHNSFLAGINPQVRKVDHEGQKSSNLDRSIRVDSDPEMNQTAGCANARVAFAFIRKVGRAKLSQSDRRLVRAPELGGAPFGHWPIAACTCASACWQAARSPA